MKKLSAIIVFLFVCLTHTAGLGFATFGLEALRLCVSARETSQITETFLYDNNDALTNWTGGAQVSPPSRLSIAYNALGQVASAGYEEYRYDALGNRIIMPVCCSDEGIVITDHADPLKRPLMEADEDDGIPYRFYIWAGNRLLGFIDDYGDNDYYLTLAHSDEQGNVIAYTEDGYLIYSANYGPHGEDWGSTGYLPAPFGWLGGYGVQTLDDGTPLKLYLTRYRLYSATLNRFLSSDPLGLEGGFNLYEYGLSNPMMYIDPLGLKPSVERNFFDNFALGFTIGDFTDDLGWGGTAGQIVAGLIPIYGQIADGRDITANALGIWDNPGSGSAWVGLGASVVGLVPLVGDAAKAGIRSAANAASDAGKAVVKNADTVARSSGPVFKTSKEASQAALRNGWTEVKGVKSGNERVFYNSENGRYYSRDNTSHIGGAWKEVDRNGNRLWTVDENLIRIGE